MKKNKKQKNENYVCERCGNPVSPFAIKCKWCKKTLRPEYYEQNNKDDKDKTTDKEGNE